MVDPKKRMRIEEILAHEWITGRIDMPTTPLRTPNILDSSGSVGKAFQVAFNIYHKAARTVTLMDVASAPLAKRRKMKHSSRDRSPSTGSSGSEKSDYSSVDLKEHLNSGNRKRKIEEHGSSSTMTNSRPSANVTVTETAHNNTQQYYNRSNLQLPLRTSVTTTSNVSTMESSVLHHLPVSSSTVPQMVNLSSLTSAYISCSSNIDTCVKRPAINTQAYNINKTTSNVENTYITGINAVKRCPPPVNQRPFMNPTAPLPGVMYSPQDQRFATPNYTRGSPVNQIPGVYPHSAHHHIPQMSVSNYTKISPVSHMPVACPPYNYAKVSPVSQMPGGFPCPPQHISPVNQMPSVCTPHNYTQNSPINQMPRPHMDQVRSIQHTLQPRVPRQQPMLVPRQTLIQPPSGYVSSITFKQDPAYGSVYQPTQPNNALTNHQHNVYNTLCTPWVDPITTGTWVNSNMSTNIPQSHNNSSNVAWKSKDDGNNNEYALLPPPMPTLHEHQSQGRFGGGGTT